jgi:NADPH2:quinone reductase
VGSGVPDLQPGQRVAAFTPGGGLAEVAVAAADVTVEVPPGVPLGTAAAAPLVVSTALLLLADRARIRPGESVLMHSASGGIGSVVSQVAAALGAGRRIGTVGRPDKIAAGLAAGWDEVFSREAGLAGAVRQVAPGGVDVIPDPAGTALLDLDLSIAAPGGRVVLFGNAAGGTQPPLPSAGRLIGGNAGVLGFSMSRLGATAPKAVASALAKGLEMIAAAQIRPELIIVESLGSVAAIHDLLAAGRGSGKYVAKVHG